MEAHARTSAAIAGIFLPLVTPFRDGALDQSSLVRLARHYGRSRIDGLILAATTGEGLTLDEEETERLVKTVAATVDAESRSILDFAAAIPARCCVGWKRRTAGPSWAI
jgi:4-hydroxy-tetrahydrodipicolinate synthase